MLPFKAILLLEKLASKVSIRIMYLCQLSGIESILVNLSLGDDDTLAHNQRDGFKIWMFNGVKIRVLISFGGRGL